MKRCIHDSQFGCPKARPGDTTESMLHSNMCDNCWGNDFVIIPETIFCPDCRETIENETYQMLKAGNRQIDCPFCKTRLNIRVNVEISY